MLNQIEKMLKVLWPDEALDGCGIGLGGPVDFAVQKVMPAALVGESILLGALALTTEHNYHQNPAGLDGTRDAVAPPLLQG
jgi:hypothetical protein